MLIASVFFVWTALGRSDIYHMLTRHVASRLVRECPRLLVIKKKSLRLY